MKRLSAVRISAGAARNIRRRKIELIRTGKLLLTCGITGNRCRIALNKYSEEKGFMKAKLVIGDQEIELADEGVSNEGKGNWNVFRVGDWGNKKENRPADGDVRGTVYVSNDLVSKIEFESKVSV
jgi:hypothetical protein